MEKKEQLQRMNEVLIDEVTQKFIKDHTRYDFNDPKLAELLDSFKRFMQTMLAQTHLERLISAANNDSSISLKITKTLDSSLWAVSIAKSNRKTNDFLSTRFRPHLVAAAKEVYEEWETYLNLKEDANVSL